MGINSPQCPDGMPRYTCSQILESTIIATIIVAHTLQTRDINTLITEEVWRADYTLSSSVLSNDRVDAIAEDG